MVYDIKKILAGRKAVEEYREAHDKLHLKPWHRGVPEEHTPLVEALVNKLKEAGFDSLDGFFEANKQANQEVLASSIIRLSSCDQCPGKEAVCVGTCWADAHEAKYKPDRIEPEYEAGRVKRLKASIKYWPDHWAPHLPLRLGDEFPMLPGCSIIVKVVKEPETDWTWK